MSLGHEVPREREREREEGGGGVTGSRVGMGILR